MLVMHLGCQAGIERHRDLCQGALEVMGHDRKKQARQERTTEPNCHPPQLGVCHRVTVAQQHDGFTMTSVRLLHLSSSGHEHERRRRHSADLPHWHVARRDAVGEGGEAVDGPPGRTVERTRGWIWEHDHGVNADQRSYPTANDNPRPHGGGAQLPTVLPFCVGRHFRQLCTCTVLRRPPRGHPSGMCLCRKSKCPPHCRTYRTPYRDMLSERASHGGVDMAVRPAGSTGQRALVVQSILCATQE
mmetsp:Transcript_15162/g.39955  ORF Transcript_15162/g.39955 Transcript_15162/m.39955 type:complete len:245 (+) Transcript_15162:867-1601(+)